MAIPTARQHRADLYELLQQSAWSTADDLITARDADIRAEERCPIGPTPQGTWPISSEVIEAGVRAYTTNYGKHGLRETLMAVWNAMHRARASSSAISGWVAEEACERRNYDEPCTEHDWPITTIGPSICTKCGALS